MSRARWIFKSADWFAALLGHWIARHRDDRLAKQNATLERKLRRQEREHQAAMNEQRLTLTYRIHYLESALEDEQRKCEELELELDRQRETTEVVERHRDATLDLLDRIAWESRARTAHSKAITQQLGVAGSQDHPDTGR